MAIIERELGPDDPIFKEGLTFSRPVPRPTTAPPSNPTIGPMEALVEKDAQGNDDDIDYEDPADTRCPICVQHDTCHEDGVCEAHLVAAIDDDEGMLGGTVYEAWDALLARLKNEIFATLVGGRRSTGRGSEMDSVVQQIRDAGFKWRSHDPEAKAEGRQPDPEQARDPFEELCCELSVDRTIRLYMEEVLAGLPGVDPRYFEISTAPGLTWVGHNYWALDAGQVAEQFSAAF